MKRLEPLEEFITISIREDPSKVIKIGENLPKSVQVESMECMQRNHDLFVWSTKEMLCLSQIYGTMQKEAVTRKGRSN